MILELKGLVSLRHDLRTFLNHIVGYTEILQEDALEFERPEFVTPLENIMSRAQEVRALVSTYFESSENTRSSVTPSMLKERFYPPVLNIISIGRDLELKAQHEKAGFLLSDIREIVTASNTLIDTIDSRLLSYELEERIREKQTGQLSTSPDDTVIPKEQVDSSDVMNDLKKDAAPPIPEITRDLTGKLLVVDDNEMNRELLTRHLERQGHSVVTAASGVEVFPILEAETIDLIILDIMMPGLNGYQVLQKLKDTPLHRDIPVIMMSALDDMESIAHCISLGAEDYLPKTFDPIILHARISASLEKKRLRDQERHYYNALLKTQMLLAAELSEAAQYVKSLLPDPIKGIISADWLFHPSTQLGGDSFGYYWLDDDHFIMYLLDVSGHGIGAALLSVSVENILRSQSLPDTNFLNCSQVLQRLNESFPMESQHNMYFTIWYGVYTRSGQTMEFASAGSPPAFLIFPDKGSDKNIVQPMRTQNTAIGINENTTFQEGSTWIPRNSKLYLFSDGAYDINRKNGKVFTLQQLEEIFRMQPIGKKATIHTIFAEIQGILQTDQFDDDFSLMEFIFS